MIKARGYVTINQLFSLLGIKSIDSGDYIGWDNKRTDFILLEHERVIIDGDLDCILICLETEPYVIY